MTPVLWIAEIRRHKRRKRCVEIPSISKWKSPTQANALNEALVCTIRYRHNKLAFGLEVPAKPALSVAVPLSMTTGWLRSNELPEASPVVSSDGILCVISFLNKSICYYSMIFPRSIGLDFRLDDDTVDLLIFISLSWVHKLRSNSWRSCLIFSPQIHRVRIDVNRHERWRHCLASKAVRKKLK